MKILTGCIIFLFIIIGIIVIGVGATYLYASSNEEENALLVNVKALKTFEDIKKIKVELQTTTNSKVFIEKLLENPDASESTSSINYLVDTGSDTVTWAAGTRTGTLSLDEYKSANKFFDYASIQQIINNNDFELTSEEIEGKTLKKYTIKDEQLSDNLITFIQEEIQKDFLTPTDNLKYSNIKVNHTGNSFVEFYVDEMNLLSHSKIIHSGIITIDFTTNYLGDDLPEDLSSNLNSKLTVDKFIISSKYSEIELKEGRDIKLLKNPLVLWGYLIWEK